MLYLKKTKSEASDGYSEWYLHTNSKAANDAYKELAGNDIASGMILQMDEDTSQKFLHDYSGDGGKGFLSIMDSLASRGRGRIELVIVDADVDISPKVLDQFDARSRPLLLKLNSRSQRAEVESRANVLTALKNADSASISVVNLMPEVAESAKPWGFQDFKAEAYAANGRKLNSDLQAFGYTVPTVKSKEEALTQLRAAAGTKKFLVLIGESGPGGHSVRIPGTDELISASDLRELPETLTVIGLVCDSQNLIRRENSAAIVGSIWTDQTRQILRVALDRRTKESTAEYLDASIGQIPLADAVSSRFSSPETGKKVLLVLLGGAMSGMAGGFPGSNDGSGGGGAGDGGGPGSTGNSPGGNTQGANGTASGLPAGSTSADPPFAQIGVSPRSTENDTRRTQLLLVFLTGVLGGLCREVLRWRELVRRRRADLYMRPKFFLLSLVLLVAGGLVAVVFVQLVPLKSFLYPVAFVCGVGIEEVVRRASMLDIWVPRVPQGPEIAAGTAAILEYLRA